MKCCQNLIGFCFCLKCFSSSAICFSIRLMSTKPSLNTMLANCFISMVGTGRWSKKHLPKSSNVKLSLAICSSRFCKKEARRAMIIFSIVGFQLWKKSSEWSESMDWLSSLSSFWVRVGASSAQLSQEPVAKENFWLICFLC